MRPASPLLSVLLLGCDARRSVHEYKIDLDLPPEQRFTNILHQFNGTVWGFYNAFFANDAVLRDALYLLSAKRGKEARSRVTIPSHR